MKKIILLAFCLILAQARAQTSCQNAAPFCAGGTSGVTFPATTSVTTGQTGPNYGCLFTTPNPSWYYLQIGNSGTLDILIQGMITSPPGPGQDVDFICWGPFNSLAGICNSLTAQNIVDCSYSGSFTETLNIPSGVTGQYYMVLITNFANIQQNIIFNQFGGTGNTDCSLLSNNYSICIGNSATVTTSPPVSLTNLSYSMNPGALTSNTPTFIVSPTVTTTYTLYATGQNNLGATLTQTATSNVTVNPVPSAAPTLTQTTCTSTVNGYDLGLVFNPSSPVPSYSITWSSIPNSIPHSSVTSYSGSIGPGQYNLTITAAGGCSTTTGFSISPIPETAAFAFSPAGPSYVITCTNPTITVNAINNNDSFTWTNGLISPQTGSTATFDHTGVSTWTVNAMNNVSGCVAQRTLSILQNTTAPSSTLTPLYQVINCTMTAITTVTATSNPTVNITHHIISPQSTTLISHLSTVAYQPGAPGTFTHILIDDINGCTTIKEFTVFSSQGYPVFNVTSPQNFTLGCGSKSFAVINYINASTTPTGGAISFTLLSPGSSPITPPTPLGTLNTYTVTSAGTWTAITKDNVSLCETRVPFSVITNTSGPGLDTVFIPRKVLDCYVSKTTLKGHSETPNVGYNWTFPGSPGNQAGDSLTVFADFSAPTATVIDNYTLTLTDLNNTCVTKTVIPVYQNLFKPIARISDGGVKALTCNTGTIELINMSSTGITANFPKSANVIGYLWEGPSPQLPVQVSSSYLAMVVGVYTMTAMDTNNGCTSVTTAAISDNRIYPIVNKPNPPQFVLDCGAGVVTLSASIQNGGTGLTYQWVHPPDAKTGNVTDKNFTSDSPGFYKVIITNTLNGCASSGDATVINGKLVADFTADKMQGPAPLEVNFTNVSASSNSVSGTSSITSVWTFGNGTHSVTTKQGAAVSTVYSLPGSYRVILYSTKGTCFDSTEKFIMVEIPSELSAPNVFTPNNDNVNDLFFLKTANISQISMMIFDRWGKKVYDVSSQTGNVAWDGRNSEGREVAEGTYFYFLTALGTDGKPFEKNGYISLFR